MGQAGQRILERMLERLFAAIVSGPGLNCRPHNSRQRIDLAHLARLKDIDPAVALRQLLGQESQATAVARVAAPPVNARVRMRDARPDEEDPAAGETPEQTAARRAWLDQQSLLSKLRTLADDARTYEDDTGVWALSLGFPLLSLPPGAIPGCTTGARRILAPIAMVPISITVRTGPGAGIKIECRCEEADRVTANESLLSWLEQQTGKPRGELFTDEEGTSPWREIAGLVRHVGASAGAEVPACFAGDELPEQIPLVAAPKSEETGDRPQIMTSAVLGLYPMSNQGLLRDTRDMIESGVEPGPVESFLRVEATLTPAAPIQAASKPAPTIDRAPTGERLIAATDPCQARAVALARTSSALVIHGPPGTGKSQTITNIIGDHLARGERVLFVCDKRTAIDVVASRLEHLGLADLCAVIHDPQRDQRDLYRSIREQLERLADTSTHPKAEPELTKLDAELEKILAELRDIHRGLMHETSDGAALHSLIGQWLDLSRRQPDAAPAAPAATLKELDAAEPEIREILSRAADANYAANPWASAAALTVEQIVSRPMDKFRAAMDTWARAAAAADSTLHESIPPFAPDQPLSEQAVARERLAGLLERALGATEAIRELWSARDPEALKRARRTLTDAAPSFDSMRQGCDAELWAIVRASPPDAAEIAKRLGALEAYLPTAKAWWGFLAIGRKSAAARVLAALGLPLCAQGAERARAFYIWLRATRTVAAAIEQFEGKPAKLDSESLEASMRGHAAVLAALCACEGPLSVAHRHMVEALKAGPGAAPAVRLADGLGRSKHRAAALEALERAATESALAADAWLRPNFAAWRRGSAAGEQSAALQAALPALEDVLRVREGFDRLPASLTAAVRALVSAAADTETGAAALRRAVTEAEVIRRLDADPRLRALDGRRMKTLFSRHAEVEARKRERVRDAIVHRWVSRQRERLLAGTGSRLNPQGAEVKRRLAIRGRHAMRLRQVLALGRAAEGGDPLLDLRPVWMASPETVAQVFPRHRVFDVVIFDEASQCRLEEALPVLTRAGRVVIAGDPRQLPPTRFFESSLATSEAEEINSDQDLFEAQQGEVEDLLGAALGLDVQQSYLDVHYRSRNSDLIAFSNEAFYGSRLQPIPGHPRNRARFAPVTLYPVAGIYDKRVNKTEAEHVCRIIRDLLKRAEPPSIGVGCFNLAQRDLIVETLDAAASEDKAFGAALAAARERRGRSSNEALFVKNLENVQGDERDHIIISTTYGPDPQGRFYRRFGPLAMPGGGRRLNVLVTRAREEVHVVTSIPPEVYRALPPVPQGQQAGGGWLLFSYLKFAEDLAARYQAARDAIHTQDQLPRPDAPAIAPPEEAIIRDTARPSAVAEALGRRLADPYGVGSIVHWGNDGFCIDVAVRHPLRAEDVTVGVLCDLTRFPLAADPVEWDLFRTAVLEGQGWDLLRLWSPIVFRDARGTMDTILAKATAAAKGGDDPDAIRVIG